jgi:hypothetical protein
LTRASVEFAAKPSVDEQAAIKVKHTPIGCKRVLNIKAPNEISMRDRMGYKTKSAALLVVNVAFFHAAICHVRPQLSELPGMRDPRDKKAPNGFARTHGADRVFRFFAVDLKLCGDAPA